MTTKRKYGAMAEVEVDKMVESYNRHKVLKLVAEELGFSTATISKYLRKRGMNLGAKDKSKPTKRIDKPYCKQLLLEGKSIQLIASAECDDCDNKRERIVAFLEKEWKKIKYN